MDRYGPQNPPKPPRSQVDPALYADDAGIVQYAVPCVHCSYSLYGLKVGAACPECGKPIGFFFDPDLHCNAPLVWLRRVRFGVRLAFGGFLASLIVGCAMWSYFFGQIVTSPHQPQFATGGNLPAAFAASATVLNIAYTVLQIAAVWCFTTRRPAPAPAEPPVGRPAVRFLIAISMMAMIAMTAVEFFLGDEVPTTPGLLPVFLGSLSVCAFGLTIVATLRYCVWLFRYMPNALWSRRAALLSWIAAIIAVLQSAAVVGILGTIHSGKSPVAPPPAPPYAIPAGFAPYSAATASGPATQYIIVQVSGTTTTTTTLPAGMTVYTPPPPSPAFVAVGTAMCPIMCVLIIFAGTLIWMTIVLYLNLGEAIRLNETRNQASTARRFMV